MSVTSVLVLSITVICAPSRTASLSVAVIPISAPALYAPSTVLDAKATMVGAMLSITSSDVLSSARVLPAKSLTITATSKTPFMPISGNCKFHVVTPLAVLISMPLPATPGYSMPSIVTTKLSPAFSVTQPVTTGVESLLICDCKVGTSGATVSITIRSDGVDQLLLLPALSVDTA